MVRKTKILNDVVDEIMDENPLELVDNVISKEETKAYHKGIKKKLKRTTNTLCLLMSVDGKINDGSSDEIDLDIDLSKIEKTKVGLNEFYEIESVNGSTVFNTGKTLEKRGVNTYVDTPNKTSTDYIVIDNKPHINEKGMKYLSELLHRVIIVTTNKKHPAYKLKRKYKNIDFIYYKEIISFTDLFIKLREEYGFDKLTIQSGGTVNSILFRNELIDYIDIVVAPVIIGGMDTPTLVDGISLKAGIDDTYIKTLELVSVKKLKNSYIHLTYKVNNINTKLNDN